MLKQEPKGVSEKHSCMRTVRKAICLFMRVRVPFNHSHKVGSSVFCSAGFGFSGPRIRGFSTIFKKTRLQNVPRERKNWASWWQA